MVFISILHNSQISFSMVSSASHVNEFVAPRSHAWKYWETLYVTAARGLRWRLPFPQLGKLLPIWNPLLFENSGKLIVIAHDVRELARAATMVTQWQQERYYSKLLLRRTYFPLKSGKIGASIFGVLNDYFNRLRSFLIRFLICTRRIIDCL